MNVKQALFILLASSHLLLACDKSEKAPESQKVNEIAPVETAEVRIVDWSKESAEETATDAIRHDLTITDPHSTIERIFSSYISFQESTDSNENKDSLKYAIQQIGDDPNWIDSTSLQLLLDIWMYYDPTDFPTRNYVEARLKEDVIASTAAVDKRIQQKKDWENPEYAPFAELPYLKRLLINSRKD
ncbi:MAG: hypothetical protein AAFZ63_20100 [Bacteroidota bacterium]